MMLATKLQEAAANSTLPTYIEDVFSTYLYTGNGNTAPETQTINNGIDLSGKGGLVWIKNRSTATNNVLFDTARGATKVLVSNATSAESTDASTLTSFNNNGFSVYYGQGVNGQNNGLASWTFRKQPKFFDVVTYTGNSVAGREIAHNLGSVPGCMIVKSTSGTDDWAVYHQSLGNTQRLVLNGTDAAITSVVWNNTTPTSTVFTVSDNARVNSNGSTYVAYLFAHDAGGFGLTGTDNVISCGSAANGNSLVTLGYEPQWVLIKGSQGSSGVGDNWLIADAMRGMVYSGNTPYLAANLSSAEDFSGGGGSWIKPTATGFQLSNLSGTGPFIYIAIRRGPMKVPTSGTSVFSPNYPPSGQTSPYTATTNFPVDFNISTPTVGGYNRSAMDRLRGGPSATQNNYLITQTTAAEQATGSGTYLNFQNNTAIIDNQWWAGYSLKPIYWNFRRAPSFFDEVCYIGTDSNLTLNHNLGVVPELLIVKARGPTAVGWFVYSAGTTTPNNFYLQLQSTNAQANAGTQVWDNTSTTFLVHSGLGLSYSAYTYVAYLFATCAGVSKVGSYTGTGTLQTINCGFTGGARFVLIKRTDSTGDWYVWDTSRGMTAGNDFQLTLNSTAAEINGNSVYTAATGFQLLASPYADVNTNGGSYIFLAIA